MPKTLAPGIDRLPSGKYRARVHVGGGRYRSRSFTRPRDAERWRETVQVAKETGRVEQVDADLQTLADLAAEHMAAARGDLADRTYAAYQRLWRAHVHSHEVASLPLRAITAQTVEDLKADLLAADVGPQSIRKTLGLVQTVMERAVRLGRIPANPVRAVKKPSAKRTSTVRPLPPADVEAIRAQLKGADPVFVSVLAYAGLRPSEARALTWGDVGRRTLRVERAADLDGSAKPTKTGHMRAVRLVAPLAGDLAAWREVCGSPAEAALLFPRADGSAWSETDYRNWRKRKFMAAAARAGVQVGRPYDLRHSAASLWLHEGINPVQVAAWLGHNVSELFKTYAHVIAEVDPADRTPAAEQVDIARRDISVTWIGGKRSPAQSTRANGTKRRKPRSGGHSGPPGRRGGVTPQDA